MASAAVRSQGFERVSRPAWTPARFPSDYSPEQQKLIAEVQDEPCLTDEQREQSLRRLFTDFDEYPADHTKQPSQIEIRGTLYNVQLDKAHANWKVGDPPLTSKPSYWLINAGRSR